jgi:uncharacterized membrane protein
MNVVNRWPRRQVLLAVLVISLALNLFFIAGAAWSRLHAPGARPSLEQQYQQIATELGLDARQRAGFDTYVSMMRDRSDKMRQEIAPLITGAWQEMAKPQANPDAVFKLFDAAADKWRGFQRESTVQTLDFLSILSPDQRTKFVAIARAHRAPWLRPHRDRH